MTTMSSREFNQDAGKAKRLAMQGPVFITDRGRLAAQRVRRLILSRPPYRRPYLRMWIYHDVSC